MASHATRKRLSGIFHLKRGIGDHSTAIPKIALIAGQPLRARGNEHLVGRLLLAAVRRVVGLQYPAQSRHSDIDAQGIGEILATQSRGSRAGVGFFRTFGGPLQGDYCQNERHGQNTPHNAKPIAIHHDAVLPNRGCCKTRRRVE
jgi:hypothetical protein